MLRWTFLLVRLLAPLPLGSNRPLPWTCWRFRSTAAAAGLERFDGNAAGALPPDRLWPAIAGLGLRRS